MADTDINLSELSDPDLVAQMHDDLYDGLKEEILDGVRILGSAQDRGGVVSFTVDRAHAHDVATLLDRQGIAVRAGHHCAEPLMHRFGLESTARASFALYTTREEIDFLADTLARVREFFT